MQRGYQLSPATLPGSQPYGEYVSTDEKMPPCMRNYRAPAFNPPSLIPRLQKNTVQPLIVCFCFEMPTNNSLVKNAFDIGVTHTINPSTRKAEAEYLSSRPASATW